MNARLPRQFSLRQLLLWTVGVCGVCAYVGLLEQIYNYDSTQSISETSLILKVPLIVAMLAIAGVGLIRATSSKK